MPPKFRLRGDQRTELVVEQVSVTTLRRDGTAKTFRFCERGDYLESTEDVPEPHEFSAVVQFRGEERSVSYEEHDHDAHHHHDNNLRAAVLHVLADAVVSVLVIVGLVAARLFGWMWMDAVAGIAGAVVICVWSRGLIRDTAAVLLDMHPDQPLGERIRGTIEVEGDRVVDLHLWRLGPGHLGAVIAVATSADRGAEFYKSRLRAFAGLSHVTVEVQTLGGR